MRISLKLAFFATTVVIASMSLGHAQAPLKPKAAAPRAGQPAEAPAAAAPNQPGWTARCASTSREAPLECAIEQTTVLSQTGQLVVLINIRVPGDTRAPIALIQLPLGLNLPGGAKIQVDDGATTDLPIQTCENRGCYASAPVTTALLTALRTGKQGKLTFQNLNKETIAIPISLTDFAAAYDKIK